MASGHPRPPIADGPWRISGDLRILRIRRGETGPGRDRIREAVAAQADILVADETVPIDDGMIAALRAAADSDPMIALVSPRAGAPEATRHLPPVTYRALADPRCVLLKASVLADFPPADDPVDIDRYALSVNRCGFRWVVANRAGLRLDRPAPSMRDRAIRLEAEFPGVGAALRADRSAAPREAERLLEALAPQADGRRALAFDATHLGRGHSGTAELTRELVRHMGAVSNDRFDIAVVAEEAVFAFHFAALPCPPRRVAPESAETFAAFVRIGQPFLWPEIEQAVRRAPALVFFLLDTIGLDGLHLAPDELDALWRFVLGEGDGFLFNSAFTRRQFERRFSLEHARPARVSLHPVDASALSEAGSGNGDVLIVGNAFPHKRVAETARLIADGCPGRRVAALGLAPDAVPGVTAIASGGLDDEGITALYCRAAVVVYPSVYEGFGLPVLEALRHRRPILLRRLPPFLEIAAALGEQPNLRWFDSDADLLRLVADPPVWIEPPPAAAARDWNACAVDLAAVVQEAIDGVSYDRMLRRIDFMRGRLAYLRTKRLTGGTGADPEADRLAGATGRFVQGAILGFAGTPPGRWLIRRLARAPGGTGRR